MAPVAQNEVPSSRSWVATKDQYTIDQYASGQNTANAIKRG